MTQQFTASEVRDWERAYKGTGAAKVFGAYADLLEAREKAVPVMVVNHVSSAEHDLPIGMKLYAHPAPSDAERLAEALRQAAQSLRTIERGAMREEGLEDAENVRAYARSRADVAGNALAAHSTQAQPQNGDWVLVPRDPTHAMRESAASYGGRGGYNKQRGDDAMEVWRDMLAAVPQPPAASVPGVSAQAHEKAQAALAAQENPNG